MKLDCLEALAAEIGALLFRDELAWTRGRPDRRFEPTADAVVDAEAALRDALRARER